MKLDQYAPIDNKGPIGQQYPYPTIWEKHILAIIHIYRAIAILLKFYDHQDTESESTNINTEKNPKALWNNDIHNPQDGWKILW